MPPVFGAFGKIPALGDFFRIALPPAFIQPWDTWLQTGMMDAREHFGGEWNTVYNSAPVWRFVLSSRQMGPVPVLGVLMSSVDRVGRQFPLTLAAQLPEDCLVAEACFSNRSTFEALEAIALDALDDGMTRDTLSSRLEAIEFVPPETSSCAGTPESLFSAASSETNLRDKLAASFLTSQYHNLSIWSADLNDTACLLCHNGMPSPIWMRHLLDPAGIDPSEGRAE